MSTPEPNRAPASMEDPNRQAVGVAPIWTGAGAEPKQAKAEPAKVEPEPKAEDTIRSGRGRRG